MSIFSRLRFGSKTPKPAEPVPDILPVRGAYNGAVPTVRFDASNVTEVVRADLAAAVRSIPEFDHRFNEAVYQFALKATLAGRDLSTLSAGIQSLNLPGMTSGRTNEIARDLCNRATAMIKASEQKRIGITRAVWRYSGAPCVGTQDQAHQEADGKEYDVSTGMNIGGLWTWPGREAGCKCFSRSIIPGNANRK